MDMKERPRVSGAVCFCRRMLINVLTVFSFLPFR